MRAALDKPAGVGKKGHRRRRFPFRTSDADENEIEILVFILAIWGSRTAGIFKIMVRLAKIAKIKTEKQG